MNVLIYAGHSCCKGRLRWAEHLGIFSLFYLMKSAVGIAIGYGLDDIGIVHLCAMHKSSVSTGFAKQNTPISYILSYNGSLVI
jgi:hypothetical protein